MERPLKKLLEEHDISGSWLAKEVDVSHSAISQLINHDIWPKRNPELLRKKIEQAMTACQVPINDISEALYPERKREYLQPPKTPKTTQSATDKEDIMLLRKQSLTPAARKKFRLLTNPFTGEIQDHSELFLTPDILYVREALLHTAKHGGFIAITGESGAGKSTLRKDLLDRIQRENLNIKIIEPYVLACEDNDIKGKTLKSVHIAESIMSVVNPLAKPFRSTEARFKQLHNALKESSRSGFSHLLIIEEGHGLPIPTIKHLKRFYELEDGYKKLLGIVVIGQPELAIKLSENNPEVREVVQRCELVTLDPLTPDGLGDYLRHRADIANIKLDTLIDGSGIQALAERLNPPSDRRGKASRSLLYPLAVGNLLTGALNDAADIGVPIVTRDVVMGV